MIYLNVPTCIRRCSKFYKFFFILLLSSLFVVLTGCSPEKVRNSLNTFKDEAKYFYGRLVDKTQTQKIDRLVKRYVKWGRFNGSILVVSEGIQIYNQSFGLAKIKEKVKLDSNSVFQTASLSKQFTAMAVMILVEKGKISYDDLVTKYLSTYPYPGTTICHLLNHTAGLPNYMWFVEHKWNRTTPPYNDDILDLLAQYKQ